MNSEYKCLHRIVFSGRSFRLALLTIVTVAAVVAVSMYSEQSEAEPDGGFTFGGDYFVSGDYAFLITDALKHTATLEAYGGSDLDVTVPSTVEYGSNTYTVTAVQSAFMDNTYIKTISIPSTVSSIGPDVVLGCTSLTAINIDPNNDWYSSAGGVLFNKSGSILVLCPEGVTGEYAVPNGVSNIGYMAFYMCKITSVTISDSVFDVEDSAFRMCGQMTTVRIGSSADIHDGNPFEYCTSLTSFEVSEDNPNLASADGVLFSKDMKTLINYPSALSGEYVVPGGVMYIYDYAFDSCGQLTSIVLPESLNKIGKGAFFNCMYLTAVDVPDGVGYIGDYAFYSCLSLESVTLPDIDSIGDGMFVNCVKLKNINIPNGLKYLGESAFQNCDGLVSIRLPDCIIKVGSSAFYNCDSLTTLVLGRSLSHIGDHAFYNCSNISEIVFLGSMPEYVEDDLFSENHVDTAVCIYGVEHGVFDDYAQGGLSIVYGTLILLDAGGICSDGYALNDGVTVSVIEGVQSDEYECLGFSASENDSSYVMEADGTPVYGADRLTDVSGLITLYADWTSSSPAAAVVIVSVFVAGILLLASCAAVFKKS